MPIGDRGLGPSSLQRETALARCSSPHVLVFCLVVALGEVGRSAIAGCCSPNSVPEFARLTTFAGAETLEDASAADLEHVTSVVLSWLRSDVDPQTYIDFMEARPGAYRSTASASADSARHGARAAFPGDREWRRLDAKDRVAWMLRYQATHLAPPLGGEGPASIVAWIGGRRPTPPEFAHAGATGSAAIHAGDARARDRRDGLDSGQDRFSSVSTPDRYPVRVRSGTGAVVPLPDRVCGKSWATTPKHLNLYCFFVYWYLEHLDSSHLTIFPLIA